MNYAAYEADHRVVFWMVACAIAATPVMGYLIARIASQSTARRLAWIYAVAGIAGMSWLCRSEPAGFRMFAIVGILLYSMKAVVAVESYAAGERPLPFLRWLSFAILWPGMQIAPFQKRASSPLAGTSAYFSGGALMIALGLSLVMLARLYWRCHSAHPTTLAYIAISLLLLPGLSLILHFGIFKLIAGCWRLAGYDCRPLFRSPFLSKTLSEFWGRRWNLAFVQMTAIAVYRPLAGRIGARRAALAGFIFSGLLHECAISLPVMAGFGFPTVFFVLHGALVTLERRLEQIGHPLSRNPRMRITWGVLWLIVPAPLLFHPWFLRGVVWPVIGAH